jgi:hypothetical protein
MPGIYIGNAVGRQSSSYWTPLKPIGGETPNLWVTSRSGLSMIDTVAAENPVITLPSLQQSNNPLVVVDNGGLDIGASAGDFTFAVRCKSNSTTKTSYPTIGGKGIDGSVNGMYYFYQTITSGKIHWLFKSTGTVKDTEINLDFTGAGWVLLLMEIDKTALVGRCFINGVQVGADVPYTGTFPSMANAYEFMLGKSNNAAGDGTNYNINAIFSEAWVYNRKLTSTEKTTITNYGHITDLTGERTHWICNNITPKDVSGNGYHLTTIDGTANNTSIVYDSSGSRYLLDKGYSKYRYYGASRTTTSIKKDLFVGYNESGVPLATPAVPTGFVKLSDHPGSLTQHNLADSYLTFVGNNWSRDNASIYGDMARSTTLKDGDGSWYLSGTPKAWHVSELNRVKMNTFFLSAYKGIAFPKVTNNSIDDRQVLTEIVGYASNKTGVDYSKALTYTGDKGHSWDISYFFSDVHYCTTRDNKILAFDDNATFSLSLDGGSTFPITKNIAGFAGGVCEMAYIFENGNILIAGKTKLYISTNNLTTITEVVPLGIDGNPWTPGDSQNYSIWQPAPPQYIEGVEVFMWGSYSNDATSDAEKVNIWFTKDNGVSVRSIYNFTAPSLIARHVDVSPVQDPNTGYFYFNTGDNADEVHFVKVECTDLSTNAFTFTKINPAGALSGDDFYHWVGYHFYNNKIYTAVEDDINVGNAGLYEALLSADLSDPANFKQTFQLPFANNSVAASFLGEANIILLPQAQSKSIMITKDAGVNSYLFRLIGGVDLAAFMGCYFGICPSNSQGYYLFNIYANGEGLGDIWKGQVIMLKIVDE